VQNTNEKEEILGPILVIYADGNFYVENDASVEKLMYMLEYTKWRLLTERSPNAK
jgi:hypothetical protein